MNNLKNYIDFLDGNGYVERPLPVEFKGLEIEWNFVQDEVRLSTNSFTWAGEVAQDINTHIANGLTGGVGIMEGLPYKIVVECNGIPQTIVEACLNTADEGATFFCDKVVLPIKETGKIDYFTDRAQSFRFETLAGITGPGSITFADYIDIWYMAGRYPQTNEIVMTGIALFVMLKEAYETIKRIADCAAAIVGGATGLAESILQLVSLTIYLILVIVALIQMINKFAQLIFPFVYYHRGMLERALWFKGTQYMGLAFSSTIFLPGSKHHNDYLMPPKNDVGKKVGVPSSETGFYDGSFAEFVKGQIEKYNGEVKIIGNTLHFERKGSFASLSNFRIPEQKYESKTRNAFELPGSYYISYLYDGIDLYDYEVFSGRKVSVTTTPITVVNQKNLLFETGIERRIPYSLPNVKSGQSDFELQMAFMFNTFAVVVNAVSSLIAPGSPSIPLIPTGANLNVLQLESHYTSVHKNGVWGGGGKTNPGSILSLAASGLLRDFHYSEIPKGIYTGIGNQWEIYGEAGEYNIPMCCDDAAFLSQVNYGKYKGNTAKFTSIKWNPYNETAKIRFRENKVYTNNLKVRIQEKGVPDVIL